MSVTFDSPPLDEVVVGGSFESLPLSVGHVGRFWDLIQDEYPTCSNQPLVADVANGVQTFEIHVGNTPVQTPRVWFSSADQSGLVQLQHDRLYFNWRQSPSQERTYIRFENIYAEFSRVSDIAASFAISQLGKRLVRTSLELSYVNVFRKGREWEKFSDLKNVFGFGRFFEVVEKLGNQKTGFCRFELELQDGPGQMAISFGSAISSSGEPVIRLELSATCEISSLNDMSSHDWYQFAHKKIVDSFMDITKSEVQLSIWRRSK